MYSWPRLTRFESQFHHSAAAWAWVGLINFSHVLVSSSIKQDEHVRVNSMCQGGWVPRCLAIWSDIILSVSVSVFLDGISISIGKSEQGRVPSLMWAGLQSVEGLSRTKGLVSPESERSPPASLPLNWDKAFSSLGLKLRHWFFLTLKLAGFWIRPSTICSPGSQVFKLGPEPYHLFCCYTAVSPAHQQQILGLVSFPYHVSQWVNLFSTVSNELFNKALFYADFSNFWVCYSVQAFDKLKGRISVRISLQVE